MMIIMQVDESYIRSVKAKILKKPGISEETNSKYDILKN
jgi:hypothetical protein